MEPHESKESKRDDDRAFEIGKIRRYYTPAEVSLHNCAKDCWVSIFGVVYDISSLVGSISKDNEDYELSIPIVANAGKDISEWFDEETREVRRKLDERTGLVLPHLPQGRFLHVAPMEPVSNWKTNFGEPWWKDPNYVIGKLSESVRQIILVNMLTYQETKLEVCEEETCSEIQKRYVDWNAHSASYTWKVLDEDVFRPLDMNLSLTDNGVVDETKLFEKLSISADAYIPTIHVYFNDDLTEA